ncbi:hypothetical protein [Protaetiibacter larvae]|uniref:Uncharacterized protein n=1 Tax=Protaetiibacter larvae TaxID=2592654 RepID=A0A5C1Y8F6_9MICO|nr:hypothetical protein [Protaetiibacter larvae]QEO09227.1 hypothetical protein FLP23_03890 [Protaetiibacter larvae]
MSIARFTRTIRAVREDDRGVALPTVIIFMFAGVLLSLVVASTVLYSYTFSSSVKASVQSQAAAEAGIAAARAGLLNGTCATQPTPGLYENTDPFYRVQIFKPDGTGGWTTGCPTISEDARIVSMGDAENGGVNGDTSGDEANVEAILGSFSSSITLDASGPAIFAYSASGAGAGGKLVSLDGTNVDVMLRTGTVTCDGGFQGAANVVVKSGTFNAVGGCNLAGNVWVNGPVNVDGGAAIGGSVTGSVVSMSNGSVAGNVWSDGAFSSTGGGVYVGGTVSATSITISQGSIGAAWARAGNVTQSGGTIRGILTANGTVTATNGNLQSAVVATGDVSVKINVASGIKSGGTVTVSNGTVTGGVTAVGGVTMSGGTINGGVTAGGTATVLGGGATMSAPVKATGVRIEGGTFGGGAISGVGCFTGNGSVGATTVGSINDTNPCKPKTTGWSWGNITVSASTAPSVAAPTLAASPLKPAAIVVPNWIDFGSKADHFTSTGWPGHTVVALGSTSCTPFHIYNALNTIGTAPGVIDARNCTNGIELTGSSTEYTGPFSWGDDLSRNGFTLKNDLVIIAKKFNLSGSSRFTGAGTESQLWLINPDTIANGSPDCATGTSMKIDGGASFPKLRTLLYSPCKITIGSSTQLKGQIFAGETQIAGGAVITYAPVGLPGYDLNTGEETSVTASEWDRPIVSQRNVTG